MSGARRWIPTLPLRGWLLASHLATLVLPLAVVVGTGALGGDLLAQTRTDLRNQAALVGLMAEAELRGASSLAEAGAALTPRLVRAKTATLAAIRVVDADGVVVATSGEQLGEDLSDHGEVRDALAGATAEAVRPRPPVSRVQPLTSDSRRASFRLFVAAPIVVDGRTVGAVLLSRTPREEVQALVQLVPGWAALLALGLTGGLAWGLGSLGTRSLRRLADVAGDVAEGRVAVDALAASGASHVAESGVMAAAVGAMAERLAARTAYVGELAASVSHEFKTPIATLRGTLELLADDGDMDQDQRRRFLANATATLDRLDRLVGGLLQLARAEQAGVREPVPLDEIAAAVRGRFEDLVVTGHAGTVSGDRPWLETALGNLVENALRHGGPGVTVRVEAWRDGDRTGLDVVDDGPGISAANLDRLFERFFTTERAHGTGLGLALVRAIAVAHGGEVSVTSRPGETRFRLSFPG